MLGKSETQTLGPRPLDYSDKIQEDNIRVKLFFPFNKEYFQGY